MEGAAQTVRQIRNNLSPGQLEKGLIQSLKDLVERFRLRTGIDTRLDVPLDVEPMIALQTCHALYRIVQQALDNVTIHARATLVSISLAQSERGVRFVIADNGCGSSAEQRARAQAQGSFGLQSMEARASALAFVPIF